MSNSKEIEMLKTNIGNKDPIFKETIEENTEYKTIMIHSSKLKSEKVWRIGTAKIGVNRMKSSLCSNIITNNHSVREQKAMWTGIRANKVQKAVDYSENRVVYKITNIVLDGTMK